MSEQQPQYLDYLPKFHIEKFHGNGTQDARRWLMDLKAEFRDRNLKIPVLPSLWVEAILREADEEAARWTDSTPHIRRIIDNYEQTTAADSTFLEQSFKERFPMVAQSQSSKTTREMLAEFSQLKSEPLPDYYKRATEFLLSPTPENSGLNCQPHLDPPVCDIDDFVDQDYNEDRHVGFQTNAVKLLVPDVPLQDFLTFEVNSSSHPPNKESNLAELQHEANLSEANLAETRKRQRMDMGDKEPVWMGRGDTLN
ncbi:hypothetical protein K3495_g5203 [Podosphaera aphanis]|nr:hypothetical protein K3495_g5203 [Podosphaera aphanis]